MDRYFQFAGMRSGIGTTTLALGMAINSGGTYSTTKAEEAEAADSFIGGDAMERQPHDLYTKAFGAGNGVTFVDLGRWDFNELLMAPNLVLVLDNSYLGIKRASGFSKAISEMDIRHTLVPKFILIEDSRRALTRSDVEAVLGHDIFRFEYDPALGRMCDAGLMSYRKLTKLQKFTETFLACV